MPVSGPLLLLLHLSCLLEELTSTQLRSNLGKQFSVDWMPCLDQRRTD